MNKVMKTFAMVLALCGSALTAAAGATRGGGGGAGKVSYSDLSVMSTGSKDNSHKETIQIESWSLGAKGVVQIVAATMPASVARLCNSRTPLPSMVLESDGKRHVFRDVVFDKCPAGGSGTFTLTFNGQTTPSAAGWGSSMYQYAHSDTTIAGLTPSKIEARLLSLQVRGNKASVIVAVPRTLSLPTSAPSASAPAVSEIVVTKNNDMTWSFSGAHVLYQDVMIPASARESSNVEMTIKILNVTIDFESMKGSRADYVDPESPLPGKR